MIGSLCRRPWGGFAGVPGAPPSPYEAAGVAAAALAALAYLLIARRRGRRTVHEVTVPAVVALALGIGVPSVVSGRLPCPHGYTGIVSVAVGLASGVVGAATATRLLGEG